MPVGAPWAWHTCPPALTRARAPSAFDARDQATGRIGLPPVRESPRRRLRAEHEARLAALGDMETTTPELNAVAMVRIDATASTDRGGLA